MQYSAIPASFVSAESGSIIGPDSKDKHLVKVTTESYTEAVSRGHAVNGKDVVVLCLENLPNKAKGERSIVSYALRLRDCQEIIQQLLCHLMSAGDETADYLMQALLYYQSQAGGSGTDEDQE